jgi:biotin-dependent carboxylase-like uncharacterized protein
VTTIRVIEPGPLALVEDLGRPGQGRRGIARSGAFDRPAMLLANRLVGNRPSAACIEVLLGPFRAVADDALIIAAAGTDAAITVDGRTLASGQAVEVPGRAPFTVQAPRHGCRSLLAVRGGVGGALVLGSRSWDSSSHIGCPPLVAGAELVVGAEVAGHPWFEAVPQRLGRGPVAVVAGPRADWLDDGEFARLCSVEWRVGAASNRLGVRLDGATLRRRPGELPSEAMVPGAVQLPPSGQPIVLGPDCGVTGGYPVIAVLTEGGLADIAQRRPGDVVRFAATSAIKSGG